MTGALLSPLLSRYLTFVTRWPRLALGCVAAVLLALGAGVPRFEIEATPDALLLEGDPALRYYRSVTARYGSDPRLVVTFQPPGELFTPAALEHLGRLRDDLTALEHVQKVTSLLDAPLLQGLSLADLPDKPPTLRSPGVDLAQARREFSASPLYRNLLVGEDGRTAALYLTLRGAAEGAQVQRRRDALLEARLERRLTAAERQRLQSLEAAASEGAVEAANELRAGVAAVRGVIARHDGGARIHLAGVPLIAADMLRFIERDLRVFGGAVFAFIVVLLAFAFRRLRWVVLAASLCAAAGLGMVGMLGWLQWRPTVVSSNSLAVLLVITLSLVVHLAVRYQELQRERPRAAPREHVEATLRSKFAPSLFTALTTIVAFASLAASGIGPVIDFGWMMVLGVAWAFGLTFVALPSALMLWPPAPPAAQRPAARGDRLLRALAAGVERRRGATLLAAAALLVLGGAGMARLAVENRFIDYFGDETEIHRGLLTLERSLGGSAPFDVIVDAPRSARPPAGDASTAAADPEGPLGGYWYNSFHLDRIERVHEHLAGLPGTGKVLSMATGIELLRELKGGPLDLLTLALVQRRLPERIRQVLLEPYLSDDGQQLRFSVRVHESARGVDAHRLLQQVRHGLVHELGFEPSQVHLTGPLVLYDNVLQTLFRSQAQTAGFVLASLLLMFWLLFRSLRVAAVALVPNVAVAVLVLGVMGWTGISLDIMTITIAAIVLGIAVDDTIHYTHRWLEERRRGDDHRQATRRAHASVGRAMAFTSITITLGFAILALSAFVPIVHFGLLACLAMMLALLADLTLLPVLLARWTLPVAPAEGSGVAA